MSTHRRRFLRLCGVAGLGAVAGCSGGSGDGETTADDETPVDSETTQSPTATLTPTPMPAETATPTDTDTPTERTGSPEQQLKLAADDGDSDDLFGSSVAMSSDGTTAIIGANGDEDPHGEGAGSAYVFENSGDAWTQQAKLTADDGDSRDTFGRSVAMSSDGTTALVGALYDEDPNGDLAGSAYIFESSGGSWAQQVKLAADDGDSRDLFSGSVAMSSDGTTALIGAPWDEDPNGRAAGSAYVFESSGGSWTQQNKLAADDGDSRDAFGSVVALSNDGTTALIGATVDDDPNGETGGSAYVFENSGGSWTQRSKLAADDGDSEDRFSHSVALSDDGTTALVSAREDDNTNGKRAGSVYVFDNSSGSWAQRTKLIAPEGDSLEFFGDGLALSNGGTTALIGTPGDGTSDVVNAGSAYVFENSGGSWTQRSKLVADNRDSRDAFGDSVAISSDGSIALVGAVEQYTRDNKPGSAYAFEL